MRTIKIGESCFGSFAEVDGQDLHQHEFDDRTDEEVGELKLKIIQLLTDNKDNLDVGDWVSIIEIIESRSTNLKEVDSWQDNCDQCGNYNWSRTLKLDI